VRLPPDESVPDCGESMPVSRSALSRTSDPPVAFSVRFLRTFVFPGSDWSMEREGLIPEPSNARLLLAPPVIPSSDKLTRSPLMVSVLLPMASLAPDSKDRVPATVMLPVMDLVPLPATARLPYCCEEFSAGTFCADPLKSIVLAVEMTCVLKLAGTVPLPCIRSVVPERSVRMPPGVVRLTE
jgi:hypothetical protein